MKTNALSGLVWLAVPLFGSLLMAQDLPPDLSGTWQSKAGHNVTLIMKEGFTTLQFKRVVQEADGRSVVSQFNCKIGGEQCDFDEGGHKAKVTLWYDGPALVILKTDGPKQDEVTQWRLTRSSDGKTLNVNLTHIVPSESPENLVFERASS